MITDPDLRRRNLGGSTINQTYIAGVWGGRVIITVLFGLHAIVVGECGCAVEFGVGQQVCLVDDETSNRRR
jgi:hypothetical protein